MKRETKFFISTVGLLTGVILYMTGNKVGSRSTPRTVEVRDVNKDGIEDVIVTSAGGKDTYFFGDKFLDGTIHLPVEIIKKMYDSKINDEVNRFKINHYTFKEKSKREFMTKYGKFENKNKDYNEVKK